MPITEGDLEFSDVDLEVDRETNLALENRADLQLARLLVRAADEDQRIIEAGYYPALNATVEGRYIPITSFRQGSEGTARRSDDIVSSEARFGGVFTWRVIDNGAVRGAVRRANPRATIIRPSWTSWRRRCREIWRASETICAHSRRVTTRWTRPSWPQNKLWPGCRTILKEGLSSQLEYRTAESSFLETKAGVLRAAFEQQLALAERDRVTGRYLQFSDDTKGKLH